MGKTKKFLILLNKQKSDVEVTLLNWANNEKDKKTKLKIFSDEKELKVYWLKLLGIITDKYILYNKYQITKTKSKFPPFSKEDESALLALNSNSLLASTIERCNGRSKLLNWFYIVVCDYY
jgi:hypothetical protein